MNKEEKRDCPFCKIEEHRIIFKNDHVIVFRDAFPVSRGHTLIIPKKHVSSIFEADEAIRDGILRALDEAKRTLDREFKPDAYNIGINDGAVAGQTIMHLHGHLIPRYKGDSSDPRGGVRWIFPGKARYWKD